MRRSFVSLHYGDGSNLINCLVFAASLRDTGTPHDRVLLLVEGTDPFERKILEPFFSRVLEIKPIKVPDTSFTNQTPPRLRGAFDKLWAFSLAEYDKVVMIDTDTLINHNIDHLFDLPTPSVFVCDDKYAWVTGEPVLAEDMAPNLGKRHGYINSGVMVISPSTDLFSSLLTTLATQPPPTEGYLYADQDFLADYFCGRWHSLSGLYNFSPKLYSLERYFGYGRVPISIPIGEIGVFHFYGDLKPLDYLNHQSQVENRAKPLRPAQKELLRRLRYDLALPLFSEARTAADHYLATFNLWFNAMRRVVAQLPTEQRLYVERLTTVSTVGEQKVGVQTAATEKMSALSVKASARRGGMRPRRR